MSDMPMTYIFKETFLISTVFIEETFLYVATDIFREYFFPAKRVLLLFKHISSLSSVCWKLWGYEAKIIKYMILIWICF